jgi:hypothetical protein
MLHYLLQILLILILLNLLTAPRAIHDYDAARRAKVEAACNRIRQ